MNSGLIHNPWVHTADQLPSTYVSLKDVILAAGWFKEVEADVHVKLAKDFPNGANCGPHLRAYMPMGREWERAALALLRDRRKADIRSDGTLEFEGEKYQTGKGVGAEGSLGRGGKDPARWKGQAKLALLDYLLKHRQAAQRKVIADGASKHGAGSAATVLRNLHDLIAYGWAVDGKSGTCLSESGAKRAQKSLRKPSM